MSWYPASCKVVSMTATFGLQLPAQPLSRWEKIAHLIVGVAVGIITRFLLVRAVWVGLPLVGFTPKAMVVLAILVCLYVPIAWLIWRRWKYVGIGVFLYAIGYLLLFFAGIALWGIVRMG
jgi:hypothetical protein